MLVESIFAQVFTKVLDRVLKDDVPVAPADAQQVAQAVTKEVAPIVVNATNSEPWYRSRIYLGLLVAALGMLGSATGYFVIPGEEIDSIVSIITMAMELGGVAYATYGRMVGATKKPLGG